MNNTANKTLIIIFIGILVTFNISYALMPEKSFSESENRVLAKFPKLSLKQIMSGDFTESFEQYVIDQVLYRDKWVFIKSGIESVLQKKENNDIYFGKDNYLFKKFKKPSDTLSNNINNLNYFASKLTELQTSVLLVPNSIKIYEDKLPKFVSVFDQLTVINTVKQNLNNGIIFSDIYSTLNNVKDEYIYFKTDHHWTMRGAYYAYTKYAEDMGFTAYNINDFSIETVSDSFFGTYYSKANKQLPADSIETFNPKFSVSYQLEYLDSESKSTSLYDTSYLTKKDKYSMFLGGNHALLKITSSVTNNKKLIVIKDSYSHCFIPFLANHYEEIHVVDLRYYKLNIYDYITENKIDNALFLYNVTSFGEDNSLDWLVR
ncbi:hypothetical protein IMX26_16880 [Clostridium sp. 'deep sea']|uniref:DHHW family protein n=1 Tax=Clostridium sp. 'deep sea' TaxID=2779445 RepID=UPI00189676F0|nr:DHHW family protein [Clostridium sp. 'deep sea']QOR35109.1 hypothetical protein IMX26_16880 [Clostridium sp. 'deep sea']